MFKTVKYVLLENVKGFEISETRNELIELLNQNCFIYQEFMLTPLEFAIPNSRLRYYLLAKKKPLEFCFPIENNIMGKLPELKPEVEIEVCKLRRKYYTPSNDEAECYKIGLIVDKKASNTIPDKILQKYGMLLDIVTSESKKSCCFTKGYGHFVEGTGSVFSPKNDHYINEVFTKLKKEKSNPAEMLDLLKSMELRYFTAQEISKLMCFPEEFTFPNYLSDKQKYRLLGNSINVHVVSILIRILVS